MSNTEFSATNGGQISAQSALTSDNVAQRNTAHTAQSENATQEQKPLKLSEFIKSEGLEPQNGKFMPDKRQLKIFGKLRR